MKKRLEVTTRWEVLILSLHPEYARKIGTGEKTVELRKNRPRVKKDDLFLVYSTAPEKAITGIGKIQAVQKKPLWELWKAVARRTGGSMEEFYAYYSGRREGVAIFLDTFWPFSKPLSLMEIRQLKPDFHPPQNYLYLHGLEFQKKWQPLVLERSGFTF